MSEPIWVAIIVGVGGPCVLFALTRIFGGRKKDRVDTETSVAAQWQAWSKELKERVGALEEDVAELKRDLERERATNARKSRLLTALIRWAIQLRDEVIRLGGDVPPAPVEVESALTTLDV